MICEDCGAKGSLHELEAHKCNPPKKENATFYTFKKSGKWAYSGRGYVSLELYSTCFCASEYHQRILEDNGGSIPGMTGNGVGYYIVVIGDEANDHGWPLHIDATYNEPSTRFV